MRLTFLFLCFLFLTLHSFSQVMLNNQSIVRDQTGKILKFDEWQALMKENEYGIKESITEKGSFIIYKYTPEQKKEMTSSKLLMMPKGGGPMPSPFFKNDAQLSNFTASDLNGHVYKLNELEGKVVVLNFWFVACAPCVKEIPELNTMVEKYRKRDDIVFLAIALDNKDEIEKMISKTPFSYHILPNGKEITKNIYKVAMFPTHVVLNKSGKVSYHTSGYHPSTVQTIEKSIEQLLGGAGK